MQIDKQDGWMLSITPPVTTHIDFEVFVRRSHKGRVCAREEIKVLTCMRR
jgi:hypothetical protein